MPVAGSVTKACSNGYLLEPSDSVFWCKGQLPLSSDTEKWCRGGPVEVNRLELSHAVDGACWVATYWDC